MNTISITCIIKQKRIIARLILYSLVIICIFFLYCSRAPSGSEIERWHIFEISFTSSHTYDNPVQDVTVSVSFTNPVGKTTVIDAFWDGGKIWRARFQPDIEGTFTYVTSCSDKKNSGLHEKKGSFICIPSNDKHALYQHGRLRLSNDGYSLAYADGTPFFWLSCTAWNGALLSTAQDWEKYLIDRKTKGFTAIQFVTTQWRAAEGDIDDRKAFEGKEKIIINPEFFQRLDKRIDAINEHDLLAAPVMLWAFIDKTGLSPGVILDDEQAVILARYILARYGAHHVLWFLGGDGSYFDEHAQRWKNIGRGVFGDKINTGERGLTTLHPRGRSWILDFYEDELWYNIAGYQSTHSGYPGGSQWICKGPPSNGWKGKKPRLVINLEPCYEGIYDHRYKEPIETYTVRRQTYWSTLIAPTAGVTYGAHGIWSWSLKEGPALNHRKESIAQPWWIALDFPGSTQMSYLRKAFETGDWWRLRPAPELIVNQPGDKDIQKFIAVSSTDNRDFTFIYIPVSIPFKLNLKTFPERLKGIWFDPRTGETSTQFSVEENEEKTFTPPKEGDWVMVLKSNQ